MVAEWFIAHDWLPLPPKTLPSTGFIAEYDGVPAAAVWLYRTDSAMSVMEWLVTNKQVSATGRHESINALLQTVITTAKELGCDIIFTSCNNEGLIRRYEGVGFKTTETGMTNLVFSGS